MNPIDKTYQPIGGRPMTAGQLKALKNREKYAKKEPIGKTGQQECARIFIIVKNEYPLTNDIICGFYSINEAIKCANFLCNVKKTDKYQIIKVLVYHKVHKWIREAVVQKKIADICGTLMDFKLTVEDIPIKKNEELIFENIKTTRKAEANIVYNPEYSNQPLIAFNKSTYALTVANGLDENNVIIEKVNIYSRLTKNMMEYFINN